MRRRICQGGKGDRKALPEGAGSLLGSEMRPEGKAFTRDISAGRGINSEVVLGENMGPHGRPVQLKDALSRSHLKVQAQSRSLDKVAHYSWGKSMTGGNGRNGGQFKAHRHLVTSADSSLLASESFTRFLSRQGRTEIALEMIIRSHCLSQTG